MKRYHLGFTVGMCVLLPCFVSAHHSISVEYDMHRQGTIQGVVSEIWFKNPHVRYYLSVTDDQGVETVWNAHGHNPVTLVRTGWMLETIQVGDHISMTGDLTRDGSPKMFIRTVELADGRVLISHPGADNHADGG